MSHWGEKETASMKNSANSHLQAVVKKIKTSDDIEEGAFFFFIMYDIAFNSKPITRRMR